MLPADSGGGLPSLATVPDPAAVSAAAALFPAIDSRMQAVVAAVVTDWKRLGGDGVFETPETSEVLGATDVVSGIAELVQYRSAMAKKALEDYASALNTVVTRMNALVPDIDAVNSADATAPASGSGAAPDAATVAARIDAVNAAAQAADAECAAALLKLQHYVPPAWLKGVVGAHDLMEHGGETVIELAEGALQRYRHLLVPKPGAALPDLVEPADVEVVARNGGIEFAQSSRSSLALPGYLVRAEQELPAVDTSGMRYHGFFVSSEEASAGAKLAWVEPAAKVAGAAGAVLTIGATGLDQYAADKSEHPDWSTAHDTSDAAVAAATEGGLSAAGAWEGAAVGAEAGAEGGAIIGSIFPGPGTAIGAAVGGIGGAIVGGIIGGGVGKAVGGAIHSGLSKISSWL